MISKELLSNVLNIDIKKVGVIEYTSSRENRLIYFTKDLYAKSINVYELMYKCMQWASDYGECGISYDIGRYKDGSKGHSISLVLTNVPCPDEYFTAEDGIDAVFEACQWIFENK